jgi:integrase
MVAEERIMASIFKRSKRKNEPYWIQYTDHLGKRKTAKGFTDKGLTEQLAGKLESEARLRKTGLIDPEQERYAEVKLADIKAHLTAFEESLADNSPKHCVVTMARVNRIVAGCCFKMLADIQSESVQTFLRSLRKSKDISPRTYNHYIQAMDSFCNWCVMTKRVLANPLLGLERLNTEVDIRRKRRALSADEVGQLIASARSSKKKINRVDGKQRARIYFLAYMTGLRKSELASLSPKSFHLDGERPTVTVEAVHSKHRRRDVLPLHSELVAELRGWFVGLATCDKLFPDLAGKNTAVMVKHDLEKIGIPYRNDEGVADFHAAGRHTHITELVRSGASLPEVKELARHSDIKMTMKYTHIGLDDQARAISNLPMPNTRPDERSNPALQMRCIPGVSGSQDTTSDGTERSEEKGLNPFNRKGLGIACHRMSINGEKAPVGVEPTMADLQSAALASWRRRRSKR